jgi:hypothetical protein
MKANDRRRELRQDSARPHEVRVVSQRPARVGYLNAGIVSH